MIQLELRPDDNTSEKGKKKFTAYYGTVPITDVLANDVNEAELKLVFVMANGMRGRVIDFDMDKLE